MKKYSIGYIDNYGDFNKVRKNGDTMKFITIEEAEKFIDIIDKKYIDNTKPIKIMQGWKVIKEVK